MPSTPLPVDTIDITQTIENSDLFKHWENPKTGVVSYLLTSNVPLAQSFYFVNNSWSSSGRYLWFYAAFPPSKRVLGVADLQTGDVRVLPDTQFLDASPMIHPDNDRAYWFSDYDLWYRSPDLAEPPVHVMHMPESLTRQRIPKRMATHLTLRADGLAVNFDAECGATWFAGDIDLATGTVSVWQEFNQCYNHAQFSPVDRDLMLINQDGWIHPVTGNHADYTHRMWLLDRHGNHRPLVTHPTPKHGHEWWHPDGQSVWVVHYGVGIERIAIDTGQIENVCPGQYSHAHSDATGRYVVTDQNLHDPYRRCHVVFHDTHTGRSVDIVNVPWFNDANQWQYHVHPHPRFSLNDQVITYTTWCANRVDIAVVSVDRLIAACAK